MQYCSGGEPAAHGLPPRQPLVQSSTRPWQMYRQSREQRRSLVLRRTTDLLALDGPDFLPLDGTDLLPLRQTRSSCGPCA